MCFLSYWVWFNRPKHSYILTEFGSLHRSLNVGTCRSWLTNRQGMAAGLGCWRGRKLLIGREEQSLIVPFLQFSSKLISRLVDEAVFFQLFLLLLAWLDARLVGSLAFIPTRNNLTHAQKIRRGRAAKIISWTSVDRRAIFSSPTTQ